MLEPVNMDIAIENVAIELECIIFNVTSIFILIIQTYFFTNLTNFHEFNEFSRIIFLKQLLTTTTLTFLTQKRTSISNKLDEFFELVEKILKKNLLEIHASYSGLKSQDECKLIIYCIV